MDPRSWSYRSRLFSALLLAGLLLRTYFLLRHPFLAGDSVLYQEIASNWLHAHVYGLSTDTVPRPTLIRLPGYPAILALCSLIFDRFSNAEPATEASFLPVFVLQIIADLLTCWLLARLAARHLGEGARTPAFALGCLCPFLANYCAVPLTETFTLLTIALTYVLAGRWREHRETTTLLALGATLAFSTLLRPDQGLLIVAVLPLLWRAGESHLYLRAKPLLLCTGVILIPFLVWTARNAITFRVFQPLTSKLAIDPGESAPAGFQHWFRTWAIDFASTEDAYWKYPEEPVDLRDLPNRAFDSYDQFLDTRILIEEADSNDRLIPSLDARFGQLAVERTRAHPLRSYLLLPAARLANMLLRPRVEMLPIEERWWQYRRHPVHTTLATGYAALNLAYLIVATLGWRYAKRLAPALTLSMTAFIALRCALLLTLDNSEPRYTLEFFPAAIFFGSAVWTRPRKKVDVRPYAT